MENQIMQDAPPIPLSSGLTSQRPSENSHPSQVQDARSNTSAATEAITAPVTSASVLSEEASSGATGAPAATDKTTAPTQLSREQILDATLQCLFEKGYDATTIRQIASRLGCAIGSIYRYYRDKHDLLSCVTQRPFEVVAEAAQNNESFPAVARMYSKLAAAETQSYVLMFWLANQKRKDADQTQATFELPAVINRIISAWSMQMGTRQAALSRWSVLHGAVTAGADALGILTAMGLMTNAGSGVKTSTSIDLDNDGIDADDEPHDRTAQQIVTVMRTPPMPRPKAQAPDASQPSIQQEQSDYDELATAEPVHQKEDVCLL